MRRAAFIGALALASCGMVGTPPVAHEIHVGIKACQMDSGQVYAEVALFSSGYYSATFPTLNGHWDHGVWQPHPSQSTEWKWYVAYTTLVVTGSSDFQMWWSLNDPRGDDDQPLQPEGGTFHLGGQPRCVQSTAMKGTPS